MAALPQDLRYAVRTLCKSPLFSSIAVLSLAFGIGANTAIFTLIHQLILRRLPVKDPAQLVILAGRGRHYGGNNGSAKLSYPMYQDLRDKNQVFSGMFSTHIDTVSTSFAGRTELVTGEFVSGNFFRVLGVGAAIGRVFAGSDDLYRGAHPLAVLSYAYWKNRFGGDPGIMGKKIIVDGYPLTVIGVSQAGFDGIEAGFAPQIRIPMMMYNSLPPGGTHDRLSDRRFRWVEVFGRLNSGISLEKAQAGLQPLFHQILEMEVQQKEFAKASPFVKGEFLKMHMEVMPGSTGRSELRALYSKPLLALMAIVALVLLIACSNLANLLLARASARQKEIAVRLALGASRARLIRQLLVESLLLSLAGGSLGVGLAVLIDRLLIHVLPTGGSPLSLSSTPDWTMLGFAALVSLIAGVIFGLVPALQSTRLQLSNTLKDQATAVAHGGSVHLRKALVVAQVALSLLLLIAAGLFLQSLRNLKFINPGFDARRLVSFAVEPTLNRYDVPWTLDYYRRLQDRLNIIPGVEATSLAIIPVMQNNEWDNWVTIEGYTPKQGETPDPHMQYCAPGFFDALKIPLLRGRDFTTKDVKGSPKVGIVNQKFAARYFAGVNPLGRHLGMGIDPGTKMDIEIVGIVGDAKYENMQDEMPYELYIPYTQPNFVSGMTAYVRAHAEPASLFNTLRRVVREVDPGVPMYDLRTLDDQIEISLFTQRLLASLSSVFGGLATLLAAMGLYGVMAFMVAQRTKEIGIRMALGAHTAAVVGMVMREVLWLAGIGIAIGAVSAWAATRLIQAQLFDIQAADLLTMAAAAFGIALVAALSGYLPARRATTIDPVRALRWE